MEDPKLKPFKVSDRRQVIRQEDRTQAVRQGEAEWRKFPFLERIFSENRIDELLSKCDATCKNLDDLVRTGTPDESERAQAAMAAYGRALELLSEITEKGEETLAKPRKP